MTAGGSAMAAEMEAMRGEGCAPPPPSPGFRDTALAFPPVAEAVSRGTYAAGADEYADTFAHPCKSAVLREALALGGQRPVPVGAVWTEVSD